MLFAPRLMQKTLSVDDGENFRLVSFFFWGGFTCLFSIRWLLITCCVFLFSLHSVKETRCGVFLLIEISSQTLEVIPSLTLSRVQKLC